MSSHLLKVQMLHVPLVSQLQNHLMQMFKRTRLILNMNVAFSVLLLRAMFQGSLKIQPKNCVQPFGQKLKGSWVSNSLASSIVRDLDELIHFTFYLKLNLMYL